MLHLGIDTHKLFSPVEVMDDCGELLDRRRLEHRDRGKLEEYFQRYDGEGVATIEATRNW